LTAIKERIKDGFNGFLVENFEEFKERALELKERANLRKKMGKNGIKVAKSYNWERISEIYAKELKI
jgi:glycosyltransferase involved in cell wall biosynthesis